MECLRQPPGSAIGGDLRVDHDRAFLLTVAVGGNPVPHRLQIVQGTHRDADGTVSPRDGRDVSFRERYRAQLCRIVMFCKVVDLGAIGGVVVDDADKGQLEADGGFQFRYALEESAVACPEDREAIRAGYAGPDGRVQSQADRLEGLGETPRGLVRSMTSTEPSDRAAVSPLRTDICSPMVLMLRPVFGLRGDPTRLTAPGRGGWTRRYATAL